MTTDAADVDSRAKHLLRSGPLVIRSSVPAERSYRAYEPALRRDFFYSCAYCTTCEAEGAGIPFTIDHYEPQSVRSDLVAQYENLMYACGPCNSRKQDLTPSSAARTAGFRYYRPDQDVFSDHFSSAGFRLDGTTGVGEFSVDALGLNRLQLRRLRELRGRLAWCQNAVFEGVAALRSVRLDQLPPNIRSKAAAAIQNAKQAEQRAMDEIEEILRTYARSPMLDEDDESEAGKRQRRDKLRALKAAYPGIWGASKAPRTAK